MPRNVLSIAWSKGVGLLPGSFAFANFGGVWAFLTQVVTVPSLVPVSTRSSPRKAAPRTIAVFDVMMTIVDLPAFKC